MKNVCCSSVWKWFLGRFKIGGDWLSLGILAALVASFIVVRWCTIEFGYLAESDISNGSVIEGNLNNRVHVDTGLLALFGILLVLVLKRKRILSPWRQLSYGNSLRIIVCVTAVVIAWMYSSYAYNFYLDSFQLLDRTVLVALFIGICFRPIFVFPFVVQAIGLASQFMYPIGGYSWAVQDQSLHLLIGFIAFYLLWLFREKLDGRLFIFFAFCLLAIHYFPSGLTKLAKGWVFEDSMEYLVPNAFANGWFHSWEHSSINRLTDNLAKISFPVKVLTLALECFGIVLLLNRIGAKIVLGAWMIFHISIFLLTGILFWQWVLVEGMFVSFLLRKERDWEIEFWGIRTFAFGCVLVASSLLWLKPVVLTWFDAKATYHYRFMAETESGEAFQLSPSFFAPYDYMFAVGNFHYLSEYKSLPIGWGATDFGTSKAMQFISTADDVIDYENERGVVEYSSENTAALTRFLENYIGRLNLSIDRKDSFRYIAAPRLVHGISEDRSYTYQEPISSVTVVQIMSFYGDNGFEEVRRRQVYQLKL